MADLSTLDATQPPDTQAVSQGAARIRETRDATKNSFGGADVGSGTPLSEHYLTGPHKFPIGMVAARPAAGNLGRLFINTEYGSVNLDTGANWTTLSTVPATFSNPGGTVNVPGPAFVTVLSHSLTSEGGAYMIWGGFEVFAVLNPLISYRLIVDLSVIVTRIFGATGTFTMGYEVSGAISPFSGSHTVALQVSSGTGAIIVRDPTLMTIIV